MSSVLSMSNTRGHIHPEMAITQVGWLGQSGTVYGLDVAEPIKAERGGYTPLYITWGEVCGHQIYAAELAAEAAEAIK